MHISVSSLGFCGPDIYGMCALAPELGIEIFCDWGGEGYWERILPEIMRDRTGKFSIHAPFQGLALDMSLADDEAAMYAFLKQPFRLYHTYEADFYVIHTNGPYADKPTAEQRAERLKRVEERLARLNDICTREGVNMLVENLAFGHGKHTLCDQQDFLKLFENNPDLNCIVDTGHALLANLDIFAIQQALGSRLKAYHVHDNDGVADAHERIATGQMDWKRFGEGARLYTPDAVHVMEYNRGVTASIEDYMEDARTLRTLCGG